MSNKSNTSRRSFLKRSAAFGGLMVLPSWCIGKQIGPNDKFRVATVGAGGMARVDITWLRQHPACQFVAFSDVDDSRTAETYNEYPDVPKFKDYRVMLDKMDKEIDGVDIGTPDHTHFPAAAWALSMNKHVCCQKPVVRTVWECRELARLAKKNPKLITQMGNQGHTLNGWRVMREWVEDDVFGKVSDIYTWSDRPGWPQGNLQVPAAQPVPAELDWKLWLGTASHQDYNPDVKNFWRGLRHYGVGAVGDMACHIVDTPYSGLELGLPTKLWGDCSEYNDYSWPAQTSVHMEFDSPHGVDGKLTLHWSDGGVKPENVRRVDQEWINRNSNVSLTVGEKYTVESDCYGSYVALHGDRDKMIEMKKAGMLEPRRHERSMSPGNSQQEWIQCCLEGKQCPSNFKYATAFTEVALLFLVSIMGKENDPLIYDPKKLRFTNSPEATKMLHSQYAYNREFLPDTVRLPRQGA